MGQDMSLSAQVRLSATIIIPPPTSYEHFKINNSYKARGLRSSAVVQTVFIAMALIAHPDRAFLNLSSLSKRSNM